MFVVKKQQKKKLLVVGLITNISIGFCLLFAPVLVSAEIPDGCPGSANPQNPPPAVCATIPLGCPGSTLQGPVAQPPTDCSPKPTANQGTFSTGDKPGKFQCGEGGSTTFTSIDLGCRGKGNGILDATFAIIRFLSIGVGIVVVGSIVLAGIQFTTSRGDPSATAKALERVRNTLIALALFIFLYAILNWLVPGAILR